MSIMFICDDALRNKPEKKKSDLGSNKGECDSIKEAEQAEDEEEAELEEKPKLAQMPMMDPSRRMSIMIGEIMPDGSIVSKELMKLPTRMSKRTGALKINFDQLGKLQEVREGLEDQSDRSSDHLIGDKYQGKEKLNYTEISLANSRKAQKQDLR